MTATMIRDGAKDRAKPKKKPPRPNSLAAGQGTPEAHFAIAGGEVPEAPRASRSPIGNPLLGDTLLVIYADALDDLERVRIATENRVRSLVQVKGMDETPEAKRMAGLVDALRALEHDAELELKRALRKHPLGAWVKGTVGIGEKQAARLLAAIGDPASRDTVSQLWAYCGLHVWHSDQDDGASQRKAVGAPSTPPSKASLTHRAPGGVAPHRLRGQKSNWNATAKMRAYLIAESCVRHRESPYRAVYDAGREKYADAVHVQACVRCGPSGSPAEPGSPLNLGHQHARAVRLVMKAVLRDLWVEARKVAES